MDGIRLIGIEQRETWNHIVKGFPDWDVYYLNEYAHSIALHEKSAPYLVYYEKDGASLCYVIMQEDIATFEPLACCLQPGMYYDWSTPYGYGGPLLAQEPTKEWVEGFGKSLRAYCRGHNVVSQFFRFHPLLQNQKVLEELEDVIYMKKTVYIDTCSEELIFKNMTPNNRNMVRKAQKNGIVIEMDQGKRLREFIDIYEATMKNNGADDYYYFGQEYFEYIREALKEHIMFFYAIYEGQVISSSIFLYNERFMHYHLSGTLPEYNKLGATNLLLTEAANWAAQKGIQRFHLGGGVGIDDGLLRFKKHFNRQGLIDFCIGRSIFDREKFNGLVELRKSHDQGFDSSKPFLITYRG